MSGSVNNDEAVGAVEDSIWELKEKFEGLAVVFAHHDHRDRYDPQGKRLEQRGDAIAGSYKIRAMADQVWHYRREQDQEWPTFTQTKGRSRYHRLDAFQVELNEETGMLSPLFPADGKWAFRMLLEKQGAMRVRDVNAWETGHGRDERTLRRWRAELVREGVVRQDAQGLQWTGKGDRLSGQASKEKADDSRD
jgi:hypothetical protein